MPGHDRDQRLEAICDICDICDMSSVQPWEPGPGKAAAGPEQRGTSLQPLSCGKLNTLWSQETNAENSPDEDVHVYIVYRGDVLFDWYEGALL